MGEFFEGWRRKIGVVMLLMALVFVGGWVRSLTIQDSFLCHRDDHSGFFVNSNQGCLSWNRIHELQPEQLRFADRYFTGDAASFDRFLNNEVNWHWKTCGFEFGETTQHNSRVRSEFGVVPYWSIVIPLTLLSAWLLLIKPRSSHRKKITEPIPEKVA